jgi:hypothetical protein
MNLNRLLITGALCASVSFLSLPTAVYAQSPMALTVQPVTGREALNVSGSGSPSQVFRVTLVSTFDFDLPDVVLSRTLVTTGSDGKFSKTISVAPGFTRNSIITVNVTTVDTGDTVASAKYYINSPNFKVSVPMDQMPNQVK